MSDCKRALVGDYSNLNTAQYLSVIRRWVIASELELASMWRLES